MKRGRSRESHDPLLRLSMLGTVINSLLRPLRLQLRRLPRANVVPVRWTTVLNNGVEYFYQDISVKRYAPWLADSEFQQVYSEVTNHTLVDVYRCYELWDLVRQVSASGIGNLLEVGVWRGGTGAIIAAATRKWMPWAKVYLADTFSGVVKAGVFDGQYKGGEHADTSVTTVTALIDRLELSNCQILQGVFPDEVAAQISDTRIALCHVDVDVYESASHIVDWVVPRLVPGGILVFDDYGFPSCPGVTRLVNELRLRPRWDFVYNLNGHAILRLRS